MITRGYIGGMTTTPQKLGDCRLCGIYAALVRSHIIPKAFFDLTDHERTTLVSNTPGEYPKRAPIGVYDRILCASCERRFDACDNYAVTALKQRLGTYERVEAGGSLVALVAKAIDYHLLKLFAVSVLWRAAVSEQNFYKRVQIGPFEEVARRMILAAEPGEPDNFASWWSFFDMDWTPGIMDPFKERWSGITAYRFYFGQVIGYIKVDRRPVPESFRDITLRPGKDLPLVARDFEKSKDLRAMGALLRTAVGRDKLRW